MDSITQIVLGAACGEVVAGKKIGNRAMIWGAIGGTIPDLDVAANFVTDEISAMAFHRGITHSLFFAFIAPVFLAYIVQRFYSSGLYQKKKWKISIVLFWIILLLAGGLIPIVQSDSPYLGTATIIYGLVIALILFIVQRRYWKQPLEEVSMSFKQWYALFFLSIFTHPILDSCTTYGTQLFQPFSDYRVAWDNISVADPFYTLPFLIFLILASFFTRSNPRRTYFAYAGILVSMIYMSYTVYHKLKIDKIFTESLSEKEISYHRFKVSPTLLNNILWQGIAEGDSSYYMGSFSFYDKEDRIVNFVEIPKNHEWIYPYIDDKDLKTLIWFSDGYYNIIKTKEGRLQYNDLRYGTLNEKTASPEDFVFSFFLDLQDGEMKASGTDYSRSMNKKDLDDFMTRLKGI